MKDINPEVLGCVFFGPTTRVRIIKVFFKDHSSSLGLKNALFIYEKQLKK
jgi:hypothetical protein